MNPIAILTADWHLSEKAPIARSAEPDWPAAQARPLKQITDLATQHNCPVLMAGDLFDRHSPGPALINWTIDHMPPNVYAVPGNHDLPLHSWKALKKSAFWTLVKARKLTLLRPGKPVEVGEGAAALRLWGFPTGFEVKPPPVHSLTIDVAVIHAYCWIPSKGHPGASDNHRAKAWRKQLDGYSLAVFGDNHKGPFQLGSRLKDLGPVVYNCGGLQRRKSDEYDHKPAVGLLYDNGTVEYKYLDCSEDKFSDAREVVAGLERAEDVDALLASLNELGDVGIDFPAAVRSALDNAALPKEVAEMCLRSLEQK